MTETTARLKFEASAYRQNAKLFDAMAASTTLSNDPLQHAHYKSRAKEMRRLAKEADEQRRGIALQARIERAIERGVDAEKAVKS